MNNSDKPRPFVEKVAQDTRDYVQSLLDEVQRLSRAVAELDAELHTHREMESVLRERMTAVENESRQFAERYVEVELQNSNLANLYVASYQLHGTLNRGRVIEAIKEIVINLVGCEELLIWERTGNMLHIAGSHGVDEEQWNYLRVGEGLIGTCVESGKRFIASEYLLDPNSQERGLTACIPLTLDDKVIGAIGVFRLLPQKDGLEPIDFELFDLLATHAASALYCTRLPNPGEQQ